jgi:hypothetical protein
VELGTLHIELNVEIVENLKKMNSWYYREMGSRNKKTGLLSYYNVKVTDYKISDCECKAREFRPHSACKHMKRLHQKLNHLSI